MRISDWSSDVCSSDLIAWLDRMAVGALLLGRLEQHSTVNSAPGTTLAPKEGRTYSAGPVNGIVMRPIRPCSASILRRIGATSAHLAGPAWLGLSDPSTECCSGAPSLGAEASASANTFRAPLDSFTGCFSIVLTPPYRCGN